MLSVVQETAAVMMSRLMRWMVRMILTVVMMTHRQSVSGKVHRWLSRIGFLLFKMLWSDGSHDVGVNMKHTSVMQTTHQVKSNRFNTCQFASESGALRWCQNRWVTRLKQFSFKPVLKCQKRISWMGLDTKRVPDCRSGCTKYCRCRWYSCCCRRRAEVDSESTVLRTDMSPEWYEFRNVSVNSAYHRC